MPLYKKLAQKKRNSKSTKLPSRSTTVPKVKLDITNANIEQLQSPTRPLTPDDRRTFTKAEKIKYSSIDMAAKIDSEQDYKRVGTKDLAKDEKNDANNWKAIIKSLLPSLEELDGRVLPKQQLKSRQEFRRHLNTILGSKTIINGLKSPNKSVNGLIGLIPNNLSASSNLNSSMVNPNISLNESHLLSDISRLNSTLGNYAIPLVQPAGYIISLNRKLYLILSL